ncbi:hypothetical protein P691DRAFT_674815 [Macrolepiota fuliginosa MF-IS2]|uniref:Uncharacterized protein n=1 Tax=Macrolepiota fuliginosa MF-IS2 TaxID=1400762 RepID=A0A9P6C1P1_9AGAR|nr:hypothetical protein P691DRAFT_674815 [Macrolepiota fuliginosa MF-IS2]
MSLLYLLHFFSIMISSVVLGLATVNFGILSIWINATAGSLSLVYHIAILLLNYRRNRATPTSPRDTTRIHRPTPRLVIPDATKNSGCLVPSGPFYCLASIFSIMVLTIITVVGFGMTVEVSIHGAKSLLPAERAKGMTFPWNMAIQKAQCTFLGVQLLLWLIVLILCMRGRSKISMVERERRDEIKYGFASPEVRISAYSMGTPVLKLALQSTRSAASGWGRNAV